MQLQWAGACERIWMLERPQNHKEKWEEMRFSVGAHGKESSCQCWSCRRHMLDPWVRKILWAGNGDPLQYSCLENFSGQMGLAGYSLRSRKVGHNWVSEYTHAWDEIDKKGQYRKQQIGPEKDDCPSLHSFLPSVRSELQTWISLNSHIISAWWIPMSVV